MRRDEPTAKKRHEFERFLGWFDKLSDRPLLLNPLQTKWFQRLYKAMLSPNYIEYYHLKPNELSDLISKALKEASTLKPIPSRTKPTREELVTNALSLLRDDLDYEEMDQVGRILIPLVLGTRAQTASLISFFRYGKFPRILFALADLTDDDTFLKLVKLDTVFLTTVCGANLIRRAQIDAKLKYRLSKALSPDRKFWSVKRERRTFIFFLLYRLKIPGTLINWYLLLQDLDPLEFPSQDAFEKAHQRAYRKLPEYLTKK